MDIKIIPLDMFFLKVGFFSFCFVNRLYDQEKTLLHTIIVPRERKEMNYSAVILNQICTKFLLFLLLQYLHVLNYYRRRETYKLQFHGTKVSLIDKNNTFFIIQLYQNAEARVYPNFRNR